MGKYTIKLGEKTYKITVPDPKRNKADNEPKPGSVDFNAREAHESRYDRLARELDEVGMTDVERDVFED